MERKYFRSNFRAYVAKNGSREGCELWAVSLTDDEDIYLGRLRSGAVERVEDYYNLPWDVHRSAERLVMLAEMTWQKFVFDYEQLRNVEWMRMTTRRRPLPDIEKIRLVKKYRKAGLTFRQIEQVIYKTVGKNLKTLYRWNKYDLSTLRGLRK